jgi:hypothetical protein
MMFLTLPVLDGRYRVVSFLPALHCGFPGVVVRAAVMGRKHHGLQDLPRGLDGSPDHW